MKQGRIIKVISNQYTIYSPEEAVVATPRGRMRKGEKPLAGDIVNYETIEGSERIDSILPRRNRLLRPAVCNVDQALIVTSLKDPDFSSRLLNRLIFLVVLCDIEPVICITKSDLLTPQEKEKSIRNSNGIEKPAIACSSPIRAAMMKNSRNCSKAGSVCCAASRVREKARC